MSNKMLLALAIVCLVAVGGFVFRNQTMEKAPEVTEAVVAEEVVAPEATEETVTPTSEEVVVEETVVAEEAAK